MKVTMDAAQEQSADFEFPPAKRQRTNTSPSTAQTTDPPTTSTASAPAPNLDALPSTADAAQETPSITTTTSIPGLSALHDSDHPRQSSQDFDDSNTILDVLMQHVQSTESPPAMHGHGEVTSSKDELGNIEVTGDIVATVSVEVHHVPQEDCATTQHNGLETPGPDSRAGAALPTNEILPATGEVEWEVDSSPYESSSDSDTTTDSSDDSDDADGEYSVLGLEEQARILMQGDGGSDDEVGGAKASNATQLRTANEKPEEIIPKPDIKITEDMKIEELGIVEGVVENTVLIKAKVSGEYRVLESGSLLCLKDRTVVGLVSELLGRVEQPFYAVRFTNDAEIKETGVSDIGNTVYFVESHSTFVFTQPLKSMKGTDASNFHDEEVGEDEMEFSDDEKEAEYKKQQKLKRQGRKDDRGGRGGYQNDPRRASVTHSHDGDNRSAYGSGTLAMNYDDAPEYADGGYTPLRRPTHTDGSQGQASSVQRSPEDNSNATKGRRNHRGRGARGSGGRNRGHPDRPHGRTDESSSRGYYNNHAGQPPPPHQQQQPFQFQPPHQPAISPQNPAYGPFSPSPISPLPRTQYNYTPQQQQQQQYGGPQHNPYSNFQAAHTHAFQSQQMPPPGSHVNPAFMAALQQYQAGQQQQPPSPQFNGQSGYNANGWGANGNR